MRRLAYLVVAVSLFLSGCGFHLRGEGKLPPSMKQVVMTGGTQVLYENLRKAFRLASSSLTRPEGDIQTNHLMIIRDQMDKRVLSVNSRGKVIEYEVSYILHFKLLDRNGNQVMPLQQIEMTRDYSFTETDVIGASQKETLLRDDLYRDMVRQIMRRIRAKVQ